MEITTQATLVANDSEPPCVCPDTDQRIERSGAATVEWRRVPGTVHTSRLDADSDRRLAT